MRCLKEKELVEIIEYGGDIMFDCAGKHYTLCAWNGEQLDIAEQKTEHNHKKFDNVADLLNHYLINGKALKEHVSEMNITYRS